MSQNIFYTLFPEKGGELEAEVTVKKGFCWNQRLTKTACESCKNACPAGAIVFDESGVPEVNQMTCTFCGLCTVTCNTGALVQNILYRDQFLGRLISISSTFNEKSGSLNLTCKGPKKDSPKIKEKYMCLAALDIGHFSLMAVSGLTKLNINLENCGGCNLETGKNILSDTINKSRSFTESLGVPLVTEEVFAVQQSNMQLETDSLIAPLKVDRRQFLKFALARGIDNLEQKPKQTERNNGEQLDKQSLILSLQKRFEGFIFPPVQPELLPLKKLSVSKHCKLCGDCQVYCPGKAIEQDETREQSTLKFDPSKCLGCDLCELMCAENALESVHFETIDFPLEKQNLFSKQKSICQMCERPFVQKSDEALCSACVKHKSLDEEIMAYF